MRPLGALVRRGTEQPSALNERSYRTAERPFGGGTPPVPCEQPEQPLRSASAATEQPNSLSAAGRRRSILDSQVVFHLRVFCLFSLKVFWVFPES